MPSVTTSAVLGAADRVWALLRDFSAIGDWRPNLPRVRVDDGPADRVRASRAFRFDDSGSRPVRDHVACPRVTPLDDEQSLVTWSARNDCDAVDEAGLLAQVRDGVFRPGIAAPAHRFHHAPTGVTR
jgi:hypothetical protein